LSLRSPSYIYIRDIIPLPVSIIPTLKYHIGNSARKLRPSFFPIILPEHNDRCFVSFSNTITKTNKRNITSCIYYKKINNNILLHVILNILDTPSIFIKARLIISARLTEYPKFSSRNLLKKNNRNFVLKN
jgi:hypothetical protein